MPDIPMRSPEAIPAKIALLGTLCDAVVVVEGATDLPIYDRLCHEVVAGRKCAARVYTPTQIRGGTQDGRQAVLEVHSTLERDAYVVEIGGRVTPCLFICDGDAEGEWGTPARHPRLVYTDHYNVENYLFVDGDVREAAIVVSEESREVAEARLPKDALLWRRSIAERVTEWVVICLLCAKFKGPESGYGRSKPFLNGDPEIGTVRDRLLAASGLSADEFSALEFRFSERVAAHIAANTFDTVFNGKWYFAFVVEDIRTCREGRPLTAGAVQLRSVLRTLMRPGWGSSIRKAIEDFLAPVCASRAS